jgi:hypothetical protein
VQCHVTFGRRVLLEGVHWIDRHPQIYTLLCLLTVIGAIAGLVFGIVVLARG